MVRLKVHTHRETEDRQTDTRHTYRKTDTDRQACTHACVYTESASLPLQHSPLHLCGMICLRGCCVHKSPGSSFSGAGKCHQSYYTNAGVNRDQHKRVCVCVTHLWSSLHPATTLEPCVEVCSQQGTQRPEQSSWAGEVSIPKFRPLSHSICVVFGISRPDKDGVSTWLSWERTL